MRRSSETIEIILIEDSKDDAELILRILKKKCISEKTLHLLNGEIALKKIFPDDESKSSPTLQPKLIILDINMPKIDGFTILKILKTHKLTCFIPVIIFSSSQHERDIKKAYEFGANCFLVKPLEYDAFVSTVEQMITFWLLLNTTYKNYQIVLKN